ncbi:MAG: hypothetical protein ACRC8Q_08330 [Aeromonas sp.]
MKIIKTGFLYFSEGDPGFFEKSYFKFLFSSHGKYENFSEFYNLRQMSGVVAQMPVAADVGSGDERDELGSG